MGYHWSLQEVAEQRQDRVEALEMTTPCSEERGTREGEEEEGGGEVVEEEEESKRGGRKNKRDV